MNQQARALEERSARGRYIELDSLRGFAAVIVLGNHIGSAFSYKPPLFLLPFFEGREAVVLFFVLSGFVLSLPFWNRGTSGSYLAFLIRRFFRIYVPFAGAAFFALVLAHFFLFSQLPLGDWFKKTWQTPITPSFILSELLLTPDAKLNTAFWSLRYEMQLSIAFPLLLVVLRRMSWRLGILLAVSIHLLSRLALMRNLPDPHWYLETLEFGSMFLVGAVLARQRESLRQWWDESSLTRRRLTLIAALACFFYGDPILWHIHRLDHLFGELTMVLGACGLILLSMFFRPLRNGLRSPVSELLGRLSFSLYLVHGTILFALLNLLYLKVSKQAIAMSFMIGSFIAAYIFCILIEEPALRLGKRLSMRR